MDGERVELVISPLYGAMPIRLPLAKVITTIGSEAEADVRIFSLPERWMVLRRESDHVVASELASGKKHRLDYGAELVLDTVTLTVHATDADDAVGLDALAGQLATAESPDDALRIIVDGVMAAAHADTAALIVSEAGAYRVVQARNKDGDSPADAAALLSDTIVRDVLDKGERLYLTNVQKHERYAMVPSVVSLKLRSVLCLPMRIDGKTLGALFLGRRDVRKSFGERLAADLKVLASLALPFLAQLRRAQRQTLAPAGLLGDSQAMQAVHRAIDRLGPADVNVLITGASGTGKELVARALHASSSRGKNPLIAVNCAAIPDSLLDAELFGYKKGAFTGAHADRQGLVEAAAGSTLFLDEVGDMPLAMQAALLRVIEQREVKRLGETQARAVDFRLVAATHRDLTQAVADGTFREDLLYRLNEVGIQLPSLAERGDDVLVLAHYFLRQAESQFSLTAHAIGDSAKSVITSHDFPGNVRQLRATMRRAALMADKHAIEAVDLGLGAPTTAEATPLGQLDRPLAEARDEFIHNYVTAVLKQHGDDREAAAQALGIGVRSLYRYLS